MAVIAGLITGISTPRVTVAQPATTTPVVSPNTPVPGEDEALYSC